MDQARLDGSLGQARAYPGERGSEMVLEIIARILNATLYDPNAPEGTRPASLSEILTAIGDLIGENKKLMVARDGTSVADALADMRDALMHGTSDPFNSVSLADLFAQYLEMQRYHYTSIRMDTGIPGQTDQLVRIDRLTGTVEFFRYDGWQPFYPSAAPVPWSTLQGGQ
jgi:hypothetical protein